jgi:hypothetical protein
VNGPERSESSAKLISRASGFVFSGQYVTSPELGDLALPHLFLIYAPDRAVGEMLARPFFRANFRLKNSLNLI